MYSSLNLPSGVTTEMFSTGPLGVRHVPNPVSDLVSDKVEYEIWFVHGLTGNRETNWKHKNGTFWPSLIANDFPTARVLTYGYDADVVKFSKDWSNAETSDLRSYGENLSMAVRNIHLENGFPYVPIYFIGHSLGGLVIEQALLLSLEADKSYKDLVPNTRGIFFMGTPHLGSHLTKWAKFMRLLIPGPIRAVNKDILEPLNKESNLCAALEAQFQKMAKHGHFKHINLFSFYEAKEMTGFRKKVVPRESAVLPSDWSASISSTHVGMVRFSGPNDSEYIKVKGQLQAWLTESKNIPDAEPPKDVETSDEQKPGDEKSDNDDEKADLPKKKEQRDGRFLGINVKGIEFLGGQPQFHNSTIRANPVTAGRDLNYKNNMWTKNIYGQREDDPGDDDEDDIGGRNTDSEVDSTDESIPDDHDALKNAEEKGIASK